MEKSTKDALDKIILSQEFLKILKDRGETSHVELYALEGKIVKYKRDYRKKLKAEDKRFQSFRGTNGKIVNFGGDWDSYWTKVFFDGEHWTDEEKDQFREAVWIHYVPTYYDCTGQVFTWAVDCFNVPRGVMCYVRDCLDV